MSVQPDNFNNPNPLYVSMLAGLLRTLVAAAGGFGMAWAAGVTGEQITLVATTAVVMGMMVWSVYQKIRASRRLSRTAMASADASAAATVQSGYATSVPVISPSTPDVTATSLNQAEIDRINRGQ